MENETYRLRPGYTAVRRDARHLQIGLDGPLVAVVQDSIDVRRLLTDLAAGQAAAPETLPARRAMQQLVDVGLAVPTAAAEPRVPVRIDAPPSLTAAAEALLGPTTSAATELVLLLSEGPLARERTDPMLRDGTPYLVVESGPDAWTVGPLVVPGVTACLRCVDATLQETDPRRALILEQLLECQVPDDDLLQALALSWAVRDLRAYLSGRRPATWSASVTLTRDADPVRRGWLRHPHCGCAWDLIMLGRQA